LRHRRAGGGGTAPQPWQGPSPLPHRPAGIRTSRGPKPPASARPAHGGRFTPAGTGAGLRWCGWRRSGWHRRAGGGGNAVRFLFPPTDRGRKVTSRNLQRRLVGRGHRPCHIAALTRGPAGGHSPRPAPDPPLGGRWPGLRLRSRSLRQCRAGGGGNAGRFLFPPTEGPEDLTGTQGPRSKTVRADLSRPCPQKTAPPNHATQGWSSWGAAGRGRGADGTHPSPPRRHGRSARH
jgi:hypothetical protein